MGGLPRIPVGLIGGGVHHGGHARGKGRDAFGHGLGYRRVRRHGRHLVLPQVQIPSRQILEFAVVVAHGAQHKGCCGNWLEGREIRRGEGEWRAIISHSGMVHNRVDM
jgi:hypothetical protein